MSARRRTLATRASMAVSGSAKLVYVSKGDPNVQKGAGTADPPAPADISGRFDVVFDN